LIFVLSFFISAHSLCHMVSSHPLTQVLSLPVLLSNSLNKILSICNWNYSACFLILSLFLPFASLYSLCSYTHIVPHAKQSTHGCSLYLTVPLSPFLIFNIVLYIHTEALIPSYHHSFQMVGSLQQSSLFPRDCSNWYAYFIFLFLSIAKLQLNLIVIIISLLQ
jgi:hypothetical protein